MVVSEAQGREGQGVICDDATRANGAVICSHQRTRAVFQRGSVDTFLLTTPLDLGPISYIRIWHDNSGGSWFLSRIMIIDLQTEERYYFICDRWLAVDEDDGQVRKAMDSGMLNTRVMTVFCQNRNSRMKSNSIQLMFGKSSV